ncbi:hypothetical protein C4D60_Mb03t15520 [Musa balbisiana]|uniref:Uncharacterized protein n=1 Tax=Musa balbisiana TaxID=52838 RepID=A0A4S8JB84_MUSBA|nr:hypothetical protein C4D60_Mb03t15520 [Musa balbisiana]
MLHYLKFETLLFKLEVLDHKARERAGVITPTFGAPIPVLLSFDAAAERGRKRKKMEEEVEEEKKKEKVEEEEMVEDEEEEE